MAVSLSEIGSLIAASAGVSGGQPCIAGTGISVFWIGSLATREGLSPEQIREDVLGGKVTLAQVHAALAYFHLNRAAMENAAITADDRYADRAAASDSLASRPR